MLDRRITAPGLSDYIGTPTRRGRVPWMFALRVLLLLLGLAAAAYFIANRVLAPGSVQGVLNAPIVTLRAPIDGVVLSGGLAVGQRVAADTDLFTLRDTRIDVRAEADLRARRDAAGTRVAEFDRYLASLATEGVAMDAKVQEFTDYEALRLLANLNSQDAAVASAQASLGLAQVQEARIRLLVQTNAAAQARLDEAAAATKVARALLDRSLADRTVAEVALGANRAHIFAQSGYGGAIYFQQRSDEIRLRRLDLQNQREAANAEQQSLQRSLTAESARLATTRQVAVHAGATGSVAATYVAAGMDVVRGTALADVFDCRALYVEAYLYAGWFGTPRPGETVEVTLYGRSDRVSGTIRSLRDAGLSLDASRSIPLAERQSRQLLTLIVDLDPNTARTLAAEGCPVGQPASVATALR